MVFLLVEDKIFSYFGLFLHIFLGYGRLRGKRSKRSIEKGLKGILIDLLLPSQLLFINEFTFYIANDIQQRRNR